MVHVKEKDEGFFFFFFLLFSREVKEEGSMGFIGLYYWALPIWARLRILVLGFESKTE